MAGGFAGGEAGAGRAEFYEGKITGYFILACIVGSFGGSLFGYDLGVSSEYSEFVITPSSCYCSCLLLLCSCCSFVLGFCHEHE